MTACHNMFRHRTGGVIMIKKTFYNLPEEKRQRIIDAILKEFSSSHPEKASINRIIKAANISRGSFYQYFDDKVDLVEVLERTFIDISLEETNKALRSCGGDIFFTYNKLFEIFTDFACDKKQSIVMENIIRSIKANDDLITDYMSTRFKGITELSDISKTAFRRDNLKFKSDEDVERLVQILTQVLKNAIFNVFIIGKPCDEVGDDYRKKLEIIKAGAVKE